MCVCVCPLPPSPPLPPPPRPQFPHPDYVGLADGLAAEIGALPRPPPLPAPLPRERAREAAPGAPQVTAALAAAPAVPSAAPVPLTPISGWDVVLPSHFRGPAMAAAAASDADVALAAFLAGRRVAHAVIRALPGDWAFRRSIVSQHPGSPSGVVEGRASFRATFPGGTELFYHETGEFVTRTGALFSFSVHLCIGRGGTR